MYMSEYDPGLGSLRKRLKKLGKVAAHVGAAFATGGAALAVSAAMVNAKKQQKAQEAAAAAPAAQEKALIAQITAPPPIAPAVTIPPSTNTGGMVAPTSFIQREETPAPMTLSTGQQPPWLMPAMLIGSGLMLTMFLGRSRQ